MATIMVIDDEPLIRTELRESLERSGHAVVEADDGTKALRTIREVSPDLVITDIVMSDMDGIQTIREVRGLVPDIAIIAISGGGPSRHDRYLDWASKLGADAIMMKPLDLTALHDAVSALLAGAKRRMN